MAVKLSDILDSCLALNALCGVKRKDDFAIEIEVETTFEKQACLEEESGMYNVLGMLRHAVYELLHGVGNINVCHRNTCEVRGVSESARGLLVDGGENVMLSNLTVEEGAKVYYTTYTSFHTFCERTRSSNV
jgi:hypothetical protein